MQPSCWGASCKPNALKPKDAAGGDSVCVCVLRRVVLLC